MTDTVTRLMDMIERYADAKANVHDWTDTFIAKARIQDELTRLLTPLSDEQIKQACKETWVFDTAKQWVRNVEKAHGIGGES